MSAKKTQRICKQGHRYYKSSDCPTCPICESERKPKNNFLAVLSAPARRALENNGITTLKKLASYTESELLELHGLGKSSIPKLSLVLSENNLEFRKSTLVTKPAPNITRMSAVKLNPEVSLFLDALKHPFRKEIEILRSCILSADDTISENVKWNGPNYSSGSADRITMRVQPLKKQVQLIFHRGAQKQTQPADKLLSTKSTLLEWKENDRAVATFKSLSEIENGSAELRKIIRDWIEAAKQ